MLSVGSEASSTEVPRDEEWFGQMTYRDARGMYRVAKDVVEVTNYCDISASRLLVAGFGTQGTVYKTGEFAVKVIQNTRCLRHIERFRQEAQILARLAHPNVCRLRGIGSAVLPSLVLDWVETDLSRVTPRSDRVAVELASALAHLHSGNAIGEGLVVIHRDVKPANVGITASGQVKLLDFGLAAVVVAAPKKGATWQLTGFVGSPTYMAPENARGARYGTPVDVYSFSLTLWELFASRGPPFKNFSLDDLDRYVVRRGQRPKLPLDWDPRLAAVVEASWAPTPTARPTASELVKVLVRLEENPGSMDPFHAPSSSSSSGSWRFSIKKKRRPPLNNNNR
ncbi:hypothetical protein CTAYLR_005409 [Chrysophaeum taylorii]|uniref:Protein kinase domain-containing protein n=1 Tax=Chrysophaeum taylorii TaxID=2483200 RepID=A0AAD7U7G4_9STRA|nr:hypothetical protein CTAYLR_005409 [Chrysophaeum taylorii]